MPLNIKELPESVLSRLLEDKTTQQNIVFACRNYEGIRPTDPIELRHLQAIIPRAFKTAEEQQLRTRQKGEVFTPAWLCCHMINFGDRALGEKYEFCRVEDKQIIMNPEQYTGNWKRYVRYRWLEVACGEAPYLTSPYDAADGKEIPFGERMGILDRKLRVINLKAGEDWHKQVRLALESCYGYEYQGDSLLLARLNMLSAYYDCYTDKWGEAPDKVRLNKAATIIAWNLWQMDGLTGRTPQRLKQETTMQLCFSDLPEMDPEDAYSLSSPTRQEDLLFDFGDDDSPFETKDCRVFDWRSKNSLYYHRIKEKRVKFDFIIGNPPYQDETLGDNKNFAPSVYDKFMDASYEVSDKVELITPARFLFNAGKNDTWNKKMLSDPDLKILQYEPKSRKIFPGTDIKGGVCISYRENGGNFGAINVFIPYEELISIFQKVTSDASFSTLSDIVITRAAYRFTDKMHADYPNAINQLSEGNAYNMASNIFERLPQVFYDKCPVDDFEYIQLYGRENNKRVLKFIRRDYVNSADNLDKYKIFVPKSNGTGALGEVLSTPMIGSPMIGYTETFISIGSFDTQAEAEACMKYIKTKFARCMLGVLKVTQDNPPERWQYVPLQDFTDKSDIDWSQSIEDIDRQLYDKYGLSEDERRFIETNIQEMK